MTQEDQPRKDETPAAPVQAGAGAPPTRQAEAESNLSTSQPDVPADDVAPDADEPGDEHTDPDLEKVAADEPAQPDEVDQKPEDVDG